MESLIILAFIDFVICVVIDRRLWFRSQLKCSHRLIVETNEKWDLCGEIFSSSEPTAPG